MKAIRSKDCDAIRWDLISPIAMETMAYFVPDISWQDSCKEALLSESIKQKFLYLKGDRHPKHFAFSAICLMTAEITKGKNLSVNIRDHINNIYRYDLIPYYGLRSLAETYKEGSLKYCAFNCELGFTISDLQNHSIEHVYRYIDGDRSEFHLSHATWGDIMSIHSHFQWPHLNKLMRQGNCELSQAILDDIKMTMEEKLANK